MSHPSGAPRPCTGWQAGQSGTGDGTRHCSCRRAPQSCHPHTEARNSTACLEGSHGASYSKHGATPVECNSMLTLISTGSAKARQRPMEPARQYHTHRLAPNRLHSWLGASHLISLPSQPSKCSERSKRGPPPSASAASSTRRVACACYEVALTIINRSESWQAW